MKIYSPPKLATKLSTTATFEKISNYKYKIELSTIHTPYYPYCMKLIILKNNLIDGINFVERSTGSSVNLPILKNLLLRADGNSITVTGTNLEVATIFTIPGKVIEKGSVTIPASIFSSVIKNLASERLTLEVKGVSLLITTDNYEATIQGVDASEFPIIPEISPESSLITIEAQTFLSSLASVIIATQYSDIRPEISGVFFRYDDGVVTLVATDSFRLAEKNFHGAKLNSSSSPSPFIIPLFAAEEILRIFKDSDGDISISVEPNQVTLSTPTKRLTSRLVDGRFPDYQAIIPKDFTREFFIDRQELMGAVRLTSSFSGKNNDMTISTGSNGKFIDIVCGDASLGENSYKVPVKLTGDEFKLVFNWRYIIDGLKVLSGQDIQWGIVSPDRPILMRSKSDSSLLYVVMPIRHP